MDIAHIQHIAVPIAEEAVIRHIMIFTETSFIANAAEDKDI